MDFDIRPWATRSTAHHSPSWPLLPERLACPSSVHQNFALFHTVELTVIQKMKNKVSVGETGASCAARGNADGAAAAGDSTVVPPKLRHQRGIALRSCGSSSERVPGELRARAPTHACATTFTAAVVTFQQMERPQHPSTGE